MRKITGIMFLAVTVLFPLEALATGGAIIRNGTIAMGVNDEGQLNVAIPPGDPDFDPDPLGRGFVGLRYMPTGGSSTESGCLCEGWGVADNVTGRAGWANEDEGGAFNIVKESFTTDNVSATCVVRVVVGGDNVFRVTHHYFPSPVTANLYQVDVTIENISDNTTEVLYRRVMDWDIWPTQFNEYVTISHYAVGDLYRTDTNGFNTANPLGPFETFEPGPVTDSGPADHGALFDFDFGLLAPGASKSFTTFYGAAGTEAAALAALVAVGAEIYSFGQPSTDGTGSASTDNGALLGIPNTFIFAFKGVGAPPIGGGSGFDLRLNALGNGGCGLAIGLDGTAARGGVGATLAGLVIYLALLLLPVLLLKRYHSRRKVRGGLILLLAAAALLIASGADAGQFSPKTQRFHPTTDGLGAFTVDSDETISPGKFNFFLGANYVKRPLNKGDVSSLTIQEDRVHNLLTFDLVGAYGLTPTIDVGIDIPYNAVQDGKDAGGADITSHDIGDIRLNGKWRFFRSGNVGLAVVPFVVFPSGDDDVFLTQKKFSYGAKLAAHRAATARLTFFANAGVEFVTGWTRESGSPDHYSAWIPFGAGAAYDLAGKRKQALVGEINGETIMDKPFSNQITTPIEWLLGYRAEVKPGVTVQVGGGRGFNKGIGAPQWRAFLGVAYLK